MSELPAALRILKEGVLAYQRDDIVTCKQRIIGYWQARSKGASQPLTEKHHVLGDDIAKALLTLVNSRLSTYPNDDNVNRPRHPMEKCNDC